MLVPGDHHIWRNERVFPGIPQKKVSDTCCILSVVLITLSSTVAKDWGQPVPKRNVVCGVSPTDLSKSYRLHFCNIYKFGNSVIMLILENGKWSQYNSSYLY